MITDTKRAQKLAVKARNSIGKYCYSECNAYCCRKGFILLKTKEARLLSGRNNKGLNELKESGILTKTEKGKYVLDLSEKETGCPQLKESKCTIHKDPDRPTACKEFPLFVWKKKGKKIIHLSGRCPAITSGILYPYIAKFKGMGFGIDYGKDE
jgi:Fe-S-cluster containining protein